MNKIKPLLPSLKERKRYILYKVCKTKHVDKEFLYKMMKKFLGEFTMSKAGVTILINKENAGIIRLNHDYVDEVKVALALINNYNGHEIKVETIKVSGVINKLKMEDVEYAA